MDMLIRLILNVIIPLLQTMSNLTKLAIIFLDILRSNATDIIIFILFFLIVGL